MINYEIDPAVLQPRVPLGTELDTWNGTCLVSMVGFQFLDTRVLGVPVPFHRDFLEVNLRFYVRRAVDGVVRRGVVFVKEIVPRRALAWVANVAYNENYIALPMSSEDSGNRVAYSWTHQLLFVVLLALVLARIPGSLLGWWQWALLGAGLSQVETVVALIIVGWFFALHYRTRMGEQSARTHNVVQVLLVFWTLAVISGLYDAVHAGLVVLPDMQVTGAGSDSSQLRFFVDHVAAALPVPALISVPLWVWRMLMLLWSLWLASSCVRWFPWAVRCFRTGGVWKSKAQTPPPAWTAQRSAEAAKPEPPPPDAVG